MSNLELTYRSFIDRISDAGKKDILFRLTRNALLTLSAFTILALLLISLEAVFEFSSVVRKVMLLGYISAFIETVISILIYTNSNYRSLSKQSNINRYAKKIGSFFPEIKDNLLNSIQIYVDTKRNPHLFSGELAAETINQFNETSKSTSFSKIVSFKKNSSLILFFISSLVIFTSLMLMFPNTFQAAANRLINYNFTFVENTLGIAYEVRPGNVEIAKGEGVNIFAKILFNDPQYKTDEITFNTKTETNDGIEISSNSEKVSAVNTNEFKAALSNVNANTIYWFE